LWPRDLLPGEGSGPLYATQQRHLARSGALLGLTGPSPVAEPIAELLDLDGLEHRQARERYLSAGGPQQRGEAVVSVLAVLDAERYGRLVAAGHRAGLWGRPWQIDPWTGRRRPPGPGPSASTNFALGSPVRGP
jgi:hypothetical protein